MKKVKSKLFTIPKLTWHKLKQKPTAYRAKILNGSIIIEFKEGCNCGAIKSGWKVIHSISSPTEDEEIIDECRQLSTAKLYAQKWYEDHVTRYLKRVK